MKEVRDIGIKGKKHDFDLHHKPIMKNRKFGKILPILFAASNHLNSFIKNA